MILKILGVIAQLRVCKQESADVSIMAGLRYLSFQRSFASINIAKTRFDCAVYETEVFASCLTTRLVLLVPL